MNYRLVNICPDSYKNLLKLFQLLWFFKYWYLSRREIQGKHWTDEFTSIDKNIDIDFMSKDVQNTINE